MHGRDVGTRQAAACGEAMRVDAHFDAADAGGSERPSLESHARPDDAFRLGRVDEAEDRLGVGRRGGALRHDDGDYRVP